MDKDRERKNLEEADRHIAELKHNIANQQQRIEGLTRKGLPTEHEDTILKVLEENLQILCRHRKIICDRLVENPTIR